MKGAFLFFFLLFSLEAASANQIVLTFENENLQTVIKKVGEFTQTTFLFDPEQVKGKITLLAPTKVTSEEALRLLQSALAIHGYTMIRKAESTWIVPAKKAPPEETVIEVVPLQYARAEEVAYTLSWVAPYGVRIVPYSPTNSLIISGDLRSVRALTELLRGKERETEKP